MGDGTAPPTRSSIAYQIEKEVIPGAVVKQVRQVAALQGTKLRRRRPR